MSLHLIHPALVHVTLAFLAVGGLIEAVGLLARWAAWSSFGSRLFLIGTVSLPLTLLTGYLAANTLAPDAQTMELLDRHEMNGWYLFGLILAGLFWKAWGRGQLTGGQRVGYALLLLVIVGLTVWSGLTGGEMVYLRGLGVQTP